MIAPQPFFEPRGTPFSVLGRIKALSQLGHRVDLVTYHIGEDISNPRVTIYRTPRIRFIKKIGIGPSLTKLFLDVLLFFKALRLLHKNSYDILHTHEEAGFFGVLLAKFYRIPHLYDMHSSLPQQLNNFQYTRFRPLIALFEWLERRTINASSAVITICPALEERVKLINQRVHQVMIENVANEGDPEMVSEEDLRLFKAAHSLDERKTVLYAGTFEPYQGIELLIDGAAQVLRQDQEVFFLMMGGKPEQVDHYQRKVMKMGLISHFRFTGIRPPKEIPMAIRLSSILVSPRISGTNTPLKIYAYLQSGKPIVATNIYSHTQVLNSDLAVMVEPKPESLARGVLMLLGDPGFAQRLGAEARRLFERRYGFQMYVQKTEQVLQMALR